MKRTKLVAIASILGIISLISLSGTAFAWHPKGVIIKKVQNITSGSVLADANTTTTAVAAKPGDLLKYVIEVGNEGAPDSNGLNDMAKTVMTDSLPSGVALVANPAQRQITENIGLIKPGQTVTKEYVVKVTATTDGSITNTACFTGDSTKNDNPQHDCNPAIVTVTVPPVIPEPPVTPTPPVTPPTPPELPHTGPAENIFLSLLAVGASWYAAHRYVQSKRELTKARNVLR